MAFLGRLTLCLSRSEVRAVTVPPELAGDTVGGMICAPFLCVSIEIGRAGDCWGVPGATWVNGVIFVVLGDRGITWASRRSIAALWCPTCHTIGCDVSAPGSVKVYVYVPWELAPNSVGRPGGVSYHPPMAITWLSASLPTPLLLGTCHSPRAGHVAVRGRPPAKARTVTDGCAHRHPVVPRPARTGGSAAVPPGHAGASGTGRHGPHRVLLIGVVGLLAAAVGTGTQIPATIQRLIDAAGLGDVSPATLAAVLGAVAAVMLIGKSVFSLLIQRKVALFLAARTAAVARRLIDGSLLEVQKRPSNWTSFAFVEGLTNDVTNVLTQYLTIVGDISVLVVLGAALLVLDPVTTIVTIAYFGLVVWSLSMWLGRWSRGVNRVYARTSIASREAIHDAIDTYRETVVAGRRGFFRDRFVDQPWQYAKAAADSSVIAAIPRFGMAIALVLGAALLVVVLVAAGCGRLFGSSRCRRVCSAWEGGAEAVWRSSAVHPCHPPG